MLTGRKALEFPDLGTARGTPRGRGLPRFLLLDPDHFKTVNDIASHAAGDRLLQQTADLLRASFRTSDYLVYWDEEFLVVARFVDRTLAPSKWKSGRTRAAHDLRLAEGAEPKEALRTFREDASAALTQGVLRVSSAGPANDSTASGQVRGKSTTNGGSLRSTS